jgi:hypothetical protein
MLGPSCVIAQGGPVSFQTPKGDVSMPQPLRKPFFRCPVVVTQRPDGSLEFHATKRDGTVEVIPGPPGVTRISTNVEIFQPEGSDEVHIGFIGGGSGGKSTS